FPVTGAQTCAPPICEDGGVRSGGGGGRRPPFTSTRPGKRRCRGQLRGYRGQSDGGYFRRRLLHRTLERRPWRKGPGGRSPGGQLYAASRRFPELSAQAATGTGGTGTAISAGSVRAESRLRFP